jgi:DUF971 family protein
LARATAIRLKRASRLLVVEFEDGERHELPCELLRVYSPSAEVRGHGEGQRILQTGKKYVNISAIDAVGNYAVRLTFDDGHDTGIYTFDYLRDMGRERGRYEREYEAELKAANASRLPAISLAHWQPDR